MYIKFFSEISKLDAAVAGGKGASLGELTQVGIPVPPGFVVLAPAFDAVLQETGIGLIIDRLLQGVNVDDGSSVDEASDRIRALITNVLIPPEIADEILHGFRLLGCEFVAVRSSATAEDAVDAAWAGQLESYLNTAETQLIERVKMCWASLFTSRAIVYRRERRFEHPISVAVVVQVMVNSEVSGVAFSVHPVSKNHHQIVIESSYGLGEAIVSGQVTPDSYILEKDTRAVVETLLSSKHRGLYRRADGGVEWRELSESQANASSMGYEELQTLAEAVQRIEAHYGFPCDIEWALEKGRLHILQSRPITTLGDDDIQPTIETKFMLNEKTSKDWMGDWRQEGVFERVVQFPAVPVLYFEAMLHCYEHNPFAESFGIRYAPTTAYGMDDQLEGWIVPATKIRVTDTSTIRAIDRSMLDLSEAADRALRPMIGRPVSSYKADVLVEAIQKINEISGEIYCGFIFYTDELLHPTDERLVHQLQQTRMKVDQLVVEGLFKAYETVIRALTEVHGFPLALIERATSHEILALLHGETVSEKAIGARTVLFATFHGEKQTLFGTEALAALRFLRAQDPSRSQLERATQDGILIGRTGNRGRVTGRVRILGAGDYRNRTVLDTLQREEGYVLVTPMTRPELVPYLKNAVGFVTDEGGITCHAAIIAREMGKPCVIGTQIATQLLHEGDLVEVDADSGVVTVLS